ncbi:MAG: hypothetical protein LKI25_02360 [Atopobiaceae bacterium]|nr:hypothetical protein [Atopobiaceae bacterium]MCI2173050.1 hypothetical protein [Atopobiaceae bacterium]MCI2208143.1 hypothetical protein [Atopobiaceae bacterium]
MDSILIKDTTREQRVTIIERSLDFCGKGSCDFCGACSMGTGDPYAIYQPYIDGIMEISEINARQAASHTGIERG